jgi:hypothetical protein
MAIDLYDPIRRKVTNSIHLDRITRHLCFSGDGRYVAGSQPQGIKVWNVHDWSEVSRGDISMAVDDELALSRTGRYVAVSSRQQVTVWEVESEQRRTIELSAECHELEFTASDTLVVASARSRFAFYSPQTGREQILPTISQPDAP